jgi:hypothetical protein
MTNNSNSLFSYALSALSIFLSAFLIFCVEPLFAKQILPVLGGSAGVWTTTMVFFQGMLLLGYVYALVLLTFVPSKFQGLVHAMVFWGITFGTFPFLTAPIMDSTPLSPISWLLRTALASLGGPFFLLSANSSISQAWFAGLQRNASVNAYRLYSVSNLGSLIGLLGYTFLFEPSYSHETIRGVWMVGFFVFGIITSILGALLFFTPSLPSEQTNVTATSPLFSFRAMCSWLILSFVPVLFFLSITTRVTTDLAPIPLLWIAPLSLYLITFTYAFSPSRSPSFTGNPRRFLFALLLGVMTYVGEPQNPIVPVLAQLWLVVEAGLYCHSLLYHLRPSTTRALPFYYVIISIGGMCGSILVSIVAPHAFDYAIIEYPLALASGALVMALYSGTYSSPHSLGSFATTTLLALLSTVALWIMDFKVFQNLEGSSAFFYAACSGLFLLVALARTKTPLIFIVGLFVSIGLYEASFFPGQIFSIRNFYSVSKVLEDSKRVRRYVSGVTLHGTQVTTPGKEMSTTSYYGPKSPISEILTDPWTVARGGVLEIVGLGIGGLTPYAKPFSKINYIEIDPDVVKIAYSYFSFLSRSPSPVSVATGDGRLELKKVPAKSLSVLVLDAFSSDSVPLHLLTREALQLYSEKLENDGQLLFNISNRFLYLEGPIARAALDLGYTTLTKKCLLTKEEEQEALLAASQWLYLTRSHERARELQSIRAWKEVIPNRTRAAWQDTHVSLIDALVR